MWPVADLAWGLLRHRGSYVVEPMRSVPDASDMTS